MTGAPKGRIRRIVEYGFLTVGLGGLAKALFSKLLDSATGSWAAAIAIGVVGGSILYVEFADRFVDRARFQWQSAKWAGVAQVYPVAPYPGLGQGAADYNIRDKGYAALVEASATARDLKLLMVSGFRFIGCQPSRGLLLPGLEQHRGGFSLEVLLLNPDGPIAQERARNQGLTPQQYADGVRAVVWTLARLRAYGYPVGVYFYEEEPIWQMVITELETWVLCASRNVATGDSPIYCLKRMAEHGLAFGMYAVWERRRSTAKALNLDDFREPDWKNLRILPPRLET